MTAVSESVIGAEDRGRPGLARVPRARAANAKDFLAYLEDLRPGTAAHLRAALPTEVMEAVERSARTDWTSIALDGIYVSEIVRWLGPARARDAWRKFTSERFIRSPAIRALADGAVRLFGLSVPAFVKYIPAAFEQGFRDCGRVEIAWSESQATVVLEDIAPEMAQHPSYAVLFEGVFLGIYDLVGVEPLFVFQPFLSERKIVARFGW